MGEPWHLSFLQHYRKYYEAQKFPFCVDPRALTSNTNPFWHFDFLQHFRKYFEAPKFSFSVDPKALTSNTNPFVLLLWFKMSNLCIWGKLDISAFFNISGNILRPNSFPLVLTPKLWPQIQTLLFYYSDLRWTISVYGGSLTFRLSLTFQVIL